MPDFSMMGNDFQGDIVLTTWSPALIKILLKEGVSRQLERDAGKHIGIEGRACFDVAAGSLRSEKFSQFEKGCITSLTRGALWAKDRAIELGYQLPPPQCPLCN
eukprot:7748919-Pyramimonas_sp.AAC.1